jgi:taurine dioxygenase
VHPETGQRSLFVNPLFTDRIDGLRRRESDALLQLLYGIATAPERQVRWRWEQGDVAFWDNRCTMHYALLDFGDSRRQMLRVALEGDQPFGPRGPGGDAGPERSMSRVL